MRRAGDWRESRSSGCAENLWARHAGGIAVRTPGG
jgi:hypothetical protein